MVVYLGDNKLIIEFHI